MTKTRNCITKNLQIKNDKINKKFIEKRYHFQLNTYFGYCLLSKICPLNSEPFNVYNTFRLFVLFVVIIGRVYVYHVNQFFTTRERATEGDKEQLKTLSLN